MITVAIAEDEAAVTRQLTNMAQYGKTWEEMNALNECKKIRRLLQSDRKCKIQIS